MAPRSTFFATTAISRKSHVVIVSGWSRSPVDIAAGRSEKLIGSELPLIAKSDVCNLVGSGGDVSKPVPSVRRVARRAAYTAPASTAIAIATRSSSLIRLSSSAAWSFFKVSRISSVTSRTLMLVDGDVVVPQPASTPRATSDSKVCSLQSDVGLPLQACSCRSK